MHIHRVTAIRQRLVEATEPLRQATEPLRRRVSWRFLAVAGAVLLVGSASVGLSRAFTVSCPPDEPCVSLAELRDGVPLPEAIRIYDREGKLLAEVAGPARRSLPPESIPQLLADAYVAVEDRRFWEHEGVDARGVLRAAVRNMREGDIEEGASTIPMQLVRTLWSEGLREVGPWRRKVIEARTAPRLIDELGHERVLATYLNAIYLGNGIYGVERAAQYYFGVGAADLTVGQTATLVGMTRSPEYYEPRRHPERAGTVREVVIDRMLDAGLIDEVDADAARSEPLGAVPLDSLDVASRKRSHMTAAVTREMRRLAPEFASRPGLAIHTTLDRLIQEEAESALRSQLDEIESGRYGRLVSKDSTSFLEGAVVALDARSGAVRAWVGGRDFSRSEFDRVDQSRRQVGSLVKPFLVALALERGYGIVDVVSADTVPIPTDDGGWLPADHVLETALPLREALVRSSNRAAAHLGMSLGLSEVSAVGRRVGLGDAVPELPSSSIGAFDASLLEMTAAYLPFGNGGMGPRPHLISRIEDVGDSVLWQRPDTTVARILDEATAFVVLDAMRAVVDRGTARSVRGWGYRGPAAGKTGTTNDGRDAWFVGLTPELVSGVWIGYDTARPIVDDRGGGALAAPVWATWMRSLQGTMPQRRVWVPPPGVERVRYDPFTGEVMGPHCGVDLGGAYHEAWVLAGSYDRSRCPRGGIGGFFDRLWRSFTTDDPKPVRPIPRRGPGG